LTSIRRLCGKAIEPTFKVTLRDAHKGTLDVDTRLLDSYEKLPANVRQFYLDARALFAANGQADFSDSEVVAAAHRHGVKLMGGPMLGDLREDGVTVWLRPATDAAISITVGDRSYPVNSSHPGAAVRTRLYGLSPATSYEYVVNLAGRTVAQEQFKTSPTQLASGPFRIAFGSCCHKIGVHNPNTFREILKRQGRKRGKENMGTRHFYVRSRFPEPRFEIISVRTAREIGPACLFRFKSFEISADNHLCRHSYKESRFRIGQRERCLYARSVELALRFTTASLRNTLCRSGYVHKRSSKIPHHG